ncbi:holo-ACP synthase [Persephonella sp. IF05-L8]|uniref:holo-ACP synthase n=1 Tax=Persephonella sp. IF05-L8 TaxID=1158338 RepID=UPI000494DC9F
MELFTGIDIVENNRIEKAYKKYGKRFLDRIYTQKEQEYCLKKTDPIPCLSARFAAKEAFVKAFNQAFGKNLSYKDIEILGRYNKPAQILLHYQGFTDDTYQNRLKYTLSISHERNYSVATVIIYIV